MTQRGIARVPGVLRHGRGHAGAAGRVRARCSSPAATDKLHVEPPAKPAKKAPAEGSGEEGRCGEEGRAGEEGCGGAEGSGEEGSRPRKAPAKKAGREEGRRDEEGGREEALRRSAGLRKPAAKKVARAKAAEVLTR